MNDFEFDEQGFLETYMTDYTHSDEIAAIDDIDCWWHGELNDEDMEEGGKGHWFADYSPAEIRETYNELMQSVLKEAFRNYLNKYYPIESNS